MAAQPAVGSKIGVAKSDTPFGPFVQHAKTNIIKSSSKTFQSFLDLKLTQQEADEVNGLKSKQDCDFFKKYSNSGGNISLSGNSSAAGMDGPGARKGSCC